MANRDAKLIERTLKDFSLNIGTDEGGVVKVDELPSPEEVKEYTVYEIEEEVTQGDFNDALFKPLSKWYNYASNGFGEPTVAVVANVAEAENFGIQNPSPILIFGRKDQSLTLIDPNGQVQIEHLEPCPDEPYDNAVGIYVSSGQIFQKPILICKDITYNNPTFSSGVHCANITVTLLDNTEKTFTGSEELDNLFNLFDSIFIYKNNLEGKILCHQGVAYETLMVDELPTAKELVDNDLICLGGQFDYGRSSALPTSKWIIPNDIRIDRFPEAYVPDGDDPIPSDRVAFKPDEYQFYNESSVYEGDIPNWDEVISSVSTFSITNKKEPFYEQNYGYYIWNATPPVIEKVTKHYIYKDNKWIDYDNIGKGTTEFIVTPANKTCYVNFSKLLDLLIAKGVDVDSEITDIDELRIGLAITYRGNNGTSLGEASLRLDCGYASGYTVHLTAFNDRWGETEYDVSGELTIRNLLSSYEGVETNYPQNYSYTVLPMLGIGTSSDADPEIYALTVEEFEEVVSWN